MSVTAGGFGPRLFYGGFMRFKTLTIALLLFAACGNPDAIFNAVTAPSADAGVTSCPMGMTLLPARPGHAATCIDTERHAATTVNAAGLACVQARATLCSIQEVFHAAEMGHIDANVKLWTGTMLPNGDPVYVNTATMDIYTGASVGNGQFYCCSR